MVEELESFKGREPSQAEESVPPTNWQLMLEYAEKLRLEPLSSNSSGESAYSFVQLGTHASLSLRALDEKRHYGHKLKSGYFFTTTWPDYFRRSVESLDKTALELAERREYPTIYDAYRTLAANSSLILERLNSPVLSLYGELVSVIRSPIGAIGFSGEHFIKSALETISHVEFIEEAMSVLDDLEIFGLNDPSWLEGVRLNGDELSKIADEARGRVITYDILHGGLR